MTLCPELWSIRRNLVSGVLSTVSISTHHFSSFNFDSASANIPVVQASRSFLNRPSVHARSVPYVSLIVFIRMIAMYGLIHKSEYLEAAIISTRQKRQFGFRSRRTSSSLPKLG